MISPARTIPTPGAAARTSTSCCAADSAAAGVTAHFPHGTETLALHAGETALLFCGEGSVTLRAGTETLTLAAHESALIEDAPAQLAVEGSAKLMLAQMYR